MSAAVYQAIQRLRTRQNRAPIGWWAGPGFGMHNCQLPRCPRGTPSGLIFRCECGSEWRWHRES